MKGKEKVSIEQYGVDGYELYRIPGIVVTNQGTVLCYYEARKSGSDWAEIDIILKRSEDEGKSFIDRKVLVKAGKEETNNNPVMIVQGETIHFIYCVNYEKVFYLQSTDDGKTFSETREITAAFDKFREKYEWNVVATGPGHGIVTTKNRLVVPVWLANGEVLDETGRKKAHEPSVVSVVYSDDAGVTWEVGGIIGIEDGCGSPNETTMCELANGDLLLNIRHASEPMYRGISISKDGGQTWSQPTYDEQLPDAGCCGGIAQVELGEYIFSNCSENTKMQPDRPFALRKWLTLYYSKDDCTSWENKIGLAEFAGYVDVAVTKDKKRALCFFEDGWHEGQPYCIEKLSVMSVGLEELKEAY